MLVSTVDGDLYPPLEEPVELLSKQARKKDKKKEKNNSEDEEDLESQLQDKLSESDEQHRGDKETHSLVMGIQKQIENMKGKGPGGSHHQSRKLGSHRFQAVLDELKQKEDGKKSSLVLYNKS
ncbi:hypothetical protein U0070_008308 [Myodes glareolus]|uniref:Uncharacterized protein n=1 Tax=Myodes glareolus TaxID=447135 RepID=A0AAW0HVG1_MYOGA